MSSGERPMERVLSSLRREMVAGERTPGEPLPLAALSERFRVSQTPVREALAHLAGEGLVEDSRGRGYACRTLDERAYRELLDLQELILGAAALWREPRAGESDLAARLERAFAHDPETTGPAAWLTAQIVVSARHGALAEALFRLQGRLGSSRRVEGRVLEAVNEELLELARSADSLDRQRLQAQIYAYHERRRGCAGKICDMLHQHRGSPIFLEPEEDGR